MCGDPTASCTLRSAPRSVASIATAFSKIKKFFHRPCRSAILGAVPRPRLRDVAELAGVSEPTVSRVLNGRSNVAASTRDKVMAAVNQLGFDAPATAPSQRRGVIGVVCGEFLNPVFPTHVHHISTELGRRGYLTNIVVTDPHLASEERCIAELTTSRVDGAVFIGGRHAEIGGDLEHYRDLARRGVPMVFVNGADTGLDVPHVYCDERAGAYKATMHLAELGHTRIGCALGYPKVIPTTRMMAGYRDALAECGLVEPDDAVLDIGFTLEGGRVGAAKLMANGITGIVCGNDLIALGAVRAAATSNGAGRDVAVVGYDGTEFTAQTAPPLTTLRQPFEDIAVHVALAIISELDGSRRFRDHYVFEPELVARASTRTSAVPAG